MFAPPDRGDARVPGLFIRIFLGAPSPRRVFARSGKIEPRPLRSCARFRTDERRTFCSLPRPRRFVDDKETLFLRLFRVFLAPFRDESDKEKSVDDKERLFAPPGRSFVDRRAGSARLSRREGSSGAVIARLSREEGSSGAVIARPGWEEPHASSAVARPFPVVARAGWEELRASSAVARSDWCVATADADRGRELADEARPSRDEARPKKVIARPFPCRRRTARDEARPEKVIARSFPCRRRTCPCRRTTCRDEARSFPCRRRTSPRRRRTFRAEARPIPCRRRTAPRRRGGFPEQARSSPSQGGACPGRRRTCRDRARPSGLFARSCFWQRTAHARDALRRMGACRPASRRACRPFSAYFRSRCAGLPTPARPRQPHRAPRRAAWRLDRPTLARHPLRTHGARS